MRKFSLNVQVRMTYAHMTDFWLDKIALELHHTKKLFYVIFGKTSLLWASKNAQYVQIFFGKSTTTLYFLQQLFATCNNLICCKTGLIRFC